jgi:hypothetical protein
MHNAYRPGNIFAINLLDNKYCNALIDLSHPEDFIFNTDKINEINNLKEIVSLINSPSKEIDIAAASSSQYNGAFSILVTGGQNDHRLIVSRYNKVDNTLCAVNMLMESINTINATSLHSDTYLIQVKTSDNNKLKYINNQSYDNHYVSCQSYIKNILGCSLEDLNFEYGDILVNIIENNTDLYTENLPGITNTETQTYTYMSKNQINTLSVPIKTVSENEQYPNGLKISCPSNIQCVVVGPNNFSHIFQGNISLINMLPGVYTIKADDKISQEDQHKSIVHKIYIGHSNKEYISIY